MLTEGRSAMPFGELKMLTSSTTVVYRLILLNLC